MCSIANNRVLLQQPQAPPLQVPAQPPAPAVPLPPGEDAATKIEEFRKQLTEATGPTRETLVRDKAIFPRGLRSEFGRQGGIDAGMLREITAIRELRKTKRPVEIKLVEDQTADASQENYLKFEAGATVLDFAVDLVPFITGDPTGVETFSGEVVGALIGAVPEFYLLAVKCREIQSGKVRLSSAVETLTTLDHLLRKIDELENQALLGPNDQERITTLRSKVSALKDGLEATFALQLDTLQQARSERTAIMVGLGGGVLELGSAATQTIGEHTTNTALSATGASLGLVAGPLSMYFTGKIIQEEGARTSAYRENQVAALTALENHPGYRTTSSAGEAVGLTRALSKMAAERSPVKESRVKTGLFATGFAATLVGTIQSGFLLGGASVAATATTLGLVASGLGVAAFLGFVGYGIYKLATSKASSTKQLQKAAFHGDGDGAPPKKLLELARIQSLKAKNDIGAVALRDRLRVAVPQIQELDSPEVMREKLAAALDPLGAAGANDLTREILSILPAKAQIDGEFLVQQNPYAPSPEIIPRCREEVFQGLLDQSIDRAFETFVASKNRAHVALLADSSWTAMISAEFAQGASGRLREAFPKALPVPCEMPPPDDVIQAIKACREKFLQIGVESNTTDAMRPILRDKFLETYSAETADRLTSVVLPTLFPRIEGVESLRNLEDIVERSRDLKKRIAESNTQAFESTLQSSSLEMGKLSAARKLLRRDPEMLLYSILDALQRAHREGRTGDCNLLENELGKYGVSQETLGVALKSESINQRLDAAGLLARSLNFLH